MSEQVLSTWKPLYRAGGIAALLAVFVFRRNLGAELFASRGFGVFDVPAAMPTRAEEWFALLQREPFVGLALLEVFDLVEYALLGLIFLTVCAALWERHRGAMLAATSAGLVGIAVYFATNQAFALLSLSQQHAAAPPAAQAVFLAAGEALLASSQGGGDALALFLALLAGLIMSVVMLRGEVFGRGAAISGILANGFGLLYFLFIPLVPGLVALPFVLSAPLRLAWYFLIAMRLFRLGREKAIA